MASDNCFQPSGGHDLVVIASTDISYFHFLRMPRETYGGNLCLKKLFENSFPIKIPSDKKALRCRFIVCFSFFPFFEETK